MPRISAAPTCEGFTLTEMLAALLAAVLLIGATSSGFLRVVLAEQRAARLHTGAAAATAEASGFFLGHSTTGVLWRAAREPHTAPADPETPWYALRLTPPGEERPYLTLYLSARHVSKKPAPETF